MEGAKLVGEISTDWDAADTLTPQVSDRLEAFTASLADTNTETDSDLV